MRAEIVVLDLLIPSTRPAGGLLRVGRKRELDRPGRRVDAPRAFAVSSLPVFGPYFERVAARATAERNLVEVRRARREFQELTGRFEEDEPWFEQRMTLFLEWYVLDREGPTGLTPAEQFMVEEHAQLGDEERDVFAGFCATHRTLVRIERWQEARLGVTDMIGGAVWSVHQGDAMVGLQKGDLLDVRLVPFRGLLHFGQGVIFHPRAAAETIQEILAEAHGRGLLSVDLLNLLAEQRLRFERQRNVKVRLVYRLPPDWGAPG
jgi:hypothetical protein